MKKIIVLFLVLILAMGLVACGKKNPTPNGNGVKKILDPLPDLVDYGSSASYYNVAKRNYSSSAKDAAIAKLQDKQDEENEKDITDDTTTFTKIFRSADVAQIVDRMATAALPEEKMTALVNYIAREDYKGSGYNFTKGVGSAIQDYEDLDYLSDLYDDEDGDYVDPDLTKNPNRETVNYNLQMKRRKVVAELVDIFGGDGDQAARVAMEELAYAQEVVIEIMIPEYNATEEGLNDPIPQSMAGFDEYFKEIFFDYDSLVYFKSYNQTVKSDDMKAKNYIPQDKKEIVQLYGYYYQYEKRNYGVFNDTEYEEYTRLSDKDYHDTDAEAVKYAGYDRRHYAQAYRYSSSFYSKYYAAHFNFQARQEAFDREVYGIGFAIPNDSKLTYSGEMKAGLQVGLESTLVLSDINYEYTGDNSKVISYNNKAKAYNSLNDIQKEEFVNLIKEVELNVEQLKSQHYTMNHSLVKETTGSEPKYLHLSNALKYQIYSYSADYIRGIQSYKKENVTLQKEIDRLNPAAPDYATLKAEKEDKIGRNEAMLKHMETNYRDAGITTQLRKADEQNWDGINTNIKDTINVNYSAYHNQTIDGRRRYETTTAMQVDEYFENMLIKRWWVKDGEKRPYSEADGANEATGWKKEYDTDHALSRLLNTHESIVRYMYGQVQVSYKQAKSSSYTIDRVSGTAQDNALLSALLAEKKATIKANSYTNRQVSTYDTDEKIALNVKPTEIEDNKAYSPSSPASEAQYNYYFVFEGWYLDEALKYKALPNETYDYDIALYPNYYIAKVPKGS